jgi:lipopolysaccharide transport system ATP-binding protein
MSEVAIQVDDLAKRYRLGQREPYRALRDVLSSAVGASRRRFSAMVRHSLSKGDHFQGRTGDGEHFWALKDVSFDVNHGEIIGIIGNNGAGKSTLLKIMSRITKPTQGRVVLHGRMGSLLEVGTGFHPELTGRENIYLNGAILGMRRAEIARKFDEIVDFAEVEAFLDTPVKRYSSGMYVRLAFAVAAHLEPEILLVDEVLAVGDAAFQKKCLGKMGDVAKEGRTILFVSHNMNAIQRLCPRSLLLDHGQLVVYDETAQVVARYLASAVNDAKPGEWTDVAHVNRVGNRQAYVEAVSYSSCKEAIALRPYTKGPLEVVLAIHTDVPRTVGSIAVILYDQNRTKLVNADTLSLGRAMRLRAGRTVIRLRIDELYLNPGAYILGWWLADPLGSVFDFVENGVNIEVVDLAPNGLGMRPKNDGAVPCTFDVVDENRDMAFEQ